MISHPNLKRVIFTCISEKEKDLLIGWRNNPSIYKWCRQNDLINPAEHDSWFDSVQKDKTIRMYLVRTDAEKPIGVCGLTSIDLINQRAEFSLYIEPDHHGKGLGKDALQLLVWHGFNAYPLQVIWGESFDGNPAIDTFKEVGFKKEGTRRDFYYRDGKHLDAHLFSIKRQEFKV